MERKTKNVPLFLSMYIITLFPPSLWIPSNLARKIALPFGAYTMHTPDWNCRDHKAIRSSAWVGLSGTKVVLFMNNAKLRHSPRNVCEYRKLPFSIISFSLDRSFPPWWKLIEVDFRAKGESPLR